DGATTSESNSRTNGIVQHQHAIGDGNGQCSSAAAFASDDRNKRNFQSRHFAEIARNRFGLTALFGPQSWTRAWRIHKRHDRTAEFLGDFHRPKGFAITFRI